MKMSHHEMGPYNQSIFLIDYFKIVTDRLKVISNHSKTIKKYYFIIISDHFNVISNHFKTYILGKSNKNDLIVKPSHLRICEK